MIPYDSVRSTRSRRTAALVAAELRRRFKSKQFAKLEGIFWLFLTTTPLVFAGGWGIIREFGPNELLRPRFYQYLWERGYRSWLLGLGVLLFVLLFRYLFAAFPLSLIQQALSQPNGLGVKQRSHSVVRLSQSIPDSELGKESKKSLAGFRNSRLVNSVRDREKAKPEAPSSAFTYLGLITTRSQKVASDSVRRANVHLIGGVLIGAIGMIFFFVSTASDEWTKSFAKATENVAATPVGTADASKLTNKAPTTESNSHVSLGVSESRLSSLTPGTLILLNFAHSLPRITILIFIEVLAGFFLKQYRTAMEEFRYYEALARRRESVVAAYLLRSESGDKTALAQLSSEVIDQPLTPLKQGETTMILEAQKLSENENMKVIEQMFGFLTKLKEEVKPNKVKDEITLRK